MRKPTDIFCHTILFDKFNLFGSIDLHFLANIEGEFTPTRLSSEARVYCLAP